LLAVGVGLMVVTVRRRRGGTSGVGIG
jgi:hypothetical protein